MTSGILTPDPLTPRLLTDKRLDDFEQKNQTKENKIIASPQGEAISRSEFNPNEVNAYTTVDGSPLVYDESGNLAEDATRRYEYNYRNLLTRVAEKGQGGAPDTEVATYDYDALGRRVWKRVPDPAGGPAEYTRYVYEGIKLIAELNARGEVQREYVYGDGLDDPIAVIARSPQGDEAIYYYHTDALGSVVALTNARGGVEERYSYDAYGMAEVTDVGGALLDASELGNPFQYTGQFFDKETGFYYYKARYYHPQLGRFLQRDPLGYVDGYNLYAYVNNNPLKYVDPLGLNRKEKGNQFPNIFEGNYNEETGRYEPYKRDYFGQELLSIEHELQGSSEEAFYRSKLGRDLLKGGIGYAIQENITDDPGHNRYLLMALGGATGKCSLCDLSLAAIGGSGSIGAALSGITKGSGIVAGSVTGVQRLVIGRSADLAKPGVLSPGEFRLSWEPAKTAKSEWKVNAGLLRMEMKKGFSIRDASPGNTGGMYLNAERNLLQNHGWKFDPATSYWVPPGY